MTDHYDCKMWNLKNKIIEKVIGNNGSIFGGAVRDKYLHDTHAIEFYEKYGVDSESYNDRTIMPELFGRWVVPSDIDIFIDESKYSDLINSLKFHFNVKEKYKRDPAKYIENIILAEGSVEHRHIVLYSQSPKQALENLSFMIYGNDCSEEIAALKQKMTDTKNYITPIHLDIMVHMNSELEAPYGKVDFLCNGLILNRDGYRVSNTVFPFKQRQAVQHNRLLQKIFEQIEKREAVVFDNRVFDNMVVSITRMTKMIRKGWEINFIDALKHVKNVTDLPNTCIICLEDFAAGDPQYKLKCCEARYHKKCLNDALNIGNTCMSRTNACIMCKKAVDQVKINKDVILLSRIEHAKSATQ